MSPKGLKKSIFFLPNWQFFGAFLQVRVFGTLFSSSWMGGGQPAAFSRHPIKRHLEPKPSPKGSLACGTHPSLEAALAGMTGQAVSTTAWAFAKLNIHLPPLMKALAARAVQEDVLSTPRRAPPDFSSRQSSCPICRLGGSAPPPHQGFFFSVW